ncbi:uncharacterized protein LOC113565465 [Drosophila persimilis]|uniref:uncharacterized protein LOC113565465 n=1 Tax=Drosophila persimilis TaxID=7234 RepID=UPI000F073E43|nr:uncharacterized protein LOC113565465 [Drosophila persimilis]
MSEQASISNVGESVFARNKKRKFSGSEDARNAEEPQVRTPRRTFLVLNEDCWREIMDYLNLKDQLRFASSNVFFGEIFKRYASRRYIHIDSRKIGDEDLKKLLQFVGDYLVSYESELNYSSNGDQHLWILRSCCKNLENLKMTFRRFRGGWDDLNSLKHLKSLHAYLHFQDVDKQCTRFAQNLKQFKCLRKLNLEAPSYNGRGLHVLDKLESLEVGYWDGFDAESLADCCQLMKQLRHLDFGYRIQNITKNNFDILVRNCKQLERLAFGVGYLDSTVPYELVCQLPKLKHLKVWHDGSVRGSLFEGLIHKRSSPLESLILIGPDLFEEQVKHLCNIYTLKELYVSCDSVPLADLLKLKNLLYLHLSMPSITNDQLLDLLKGLPHLKVLNIGNNFNIDGSFVNRVRTWVSEQKELRGKIKIYLSHNVDTVNVEPFIEIIRGSLIDPILIREELSEQI